MAAALQGGATWGMMEDAPEELDDVDENNGGCRGMHVQVGCVARSLAAPYVHAACRGLNKSGAWPQGWAA